MTTIAYRDGMMAADSRAYAGNASPVGSKTKINRLKEGSLFACSTSKTGAMEQFVRLLNELDEPETCMIKDAEDLKVNGLLVKPDGRVFHIFETPFFSGPLTAKFWAVGSGEHYALGAMQTGATAVDAVVAACALDVYSDGPVKVVYLAEKHDPLRGVDELGNFTNGLNLRKNGDNSLPK